MRTIKEFLWMYYYSLWWSPSLSPRSHMLFNSKSPQIETESGSRKRHRTLMNSNDDVATKRNKINEEDDKGESSLISSFVCEICIETKAQSESFSIRGCSHSYCRDCVVKYIGSKLDENVINIRCPVPRCSGLLESEDCRDVLPKLVFDRWENSLCNAAVMDNESERFIYCPFRDCSALIILDDSPTLPTKSECPNCNRKICAACVAVWHDGIRCEEFPRVIIDNEDRVVMELAVKNNWRRCPYCKLYVEKKPFWCNSILCRCGNFFCYGCGGSRGSCFCFCFGRHTSLLGFVRRLLMD
ncbi:hypothetical protein PIB30_019676 [Stylosanthes scabra]|uniref:RBR-type E3 ubiquitin transferase n=1 Tax=Stylosanthes scabra TaxID=79078 RepID=A0ABU6TAC1_9FABA|nr:hypothetical protein [Stylosanthes scabra]